MGSIVCQNIDSWRKLRYKASMTRRILWCLILAVSLASCNFPVKVNMAQVFDTATPEPTSTPADTPTPTNTPTNTPSPTPQPAARVVLAEEALAAGSYEQARRQFQEAMQNAADSELQAAAALGMGRTLLAQANYPGAIETLRGLIAGFPQYRELDKAYYFLGKAYNAVENYTAAADAYQSYIDLSDGVLNDFIHELRGDAYQNAGLPGSAVAAYTSAIEASGDRSTIWLEMKRGRAYARNGDFADAITQFIQIYERTDNEFAKAQANYLLGQTYLTMDLPEQAYARFQDSVTNYPRAYDSYSGLVALVNAGVPVNELERGIVNYYAGQYGLSVQALTRYLNSEVEHDGSAYHFRALSRRAINELDDAIDDWDTLIDQYPGSRYWAAAWDEKAYTLWGWLNKHAEAAATLLAFVEQNPAAPDAPDFLFKAARILERNRQYPEAAAAWERMINEYPSAANSYRGLFLAGVTYYRAGDYSKALLVFQRALVLTDQPGDQAAAYLWIGKVQQAQGDTAAMRAAWEQGAQRDPTGYYSERANELLQGREPFQPTRPYDLGYDLNLERGRAEAWMRATFQLAPETNFNDLADLSGDMNFRRGNAFWDLDELGRARDEFESLRRKVLADPLNTYRLMNHLYGLRFYRSALLASRNILDLANLDDAGTLTAPEYFNHIRFGIYYKDLVMEYSRERNLHPLFLLSVMRQESLFEGYAISSAGARGLMQIMPATGKEIYDNLRWPEGYTSDDLYRPEVSIRFGAHYLARQRDYFKGNMFAALAAYNGGPGNTIIWTELAGDDPDLLLEVIRAEETRRYIIQIYEFFNLYRLLYERGL